MDQITGGVLAQIDRAKAWMDSFNGPPEELADAIDLASAWEEFFKHCKTGLETQNLAAELKLRLQRKLGGLLGDVPPRGRPGKNEHAAHLPDGLDRFAANRLRKIAAVPAVEFENYLLTTKHEDGELTTAGVLRLYAALNRTSQNGDTVPKEVQPDESDEVRPEFWKSADTCRDEIRRIKRKLKDVQTVLSGLVESPYKPLLKKATHGDKSVALSWDGTETERNGVLGAVMVERVYTCPVLDSLTTLVAGLEVLFDRECGE